MLQISSRGIEFFSKVQKVIWMTLKVKFFIFKEIEFSEGTHQCRPESRFSFHSVCSHQPGCYFSHLSLIPDVEVM